MRVPAKIRVFLSSFQIIAITNPSHNFSLQSTEPKHNYFYDLSLAMGFTWANNMDIIKAAAQ